MPVSQWARCFYKQNNCRRQANMKLAAGNFLSTSIVSIVTSVKYLKPVAFNPDFAEELVNWASTKILRLILRHPHERFRHQRVTYQQNVHFYSGLLTRQTTFSSTLQRPSCFSTANSLLTNLMRICVNYYSRFHHVMLFVLLT
jgi:hypothetical protein